MGVSQLSGQGLGERQPQLSNCGLWEIFGGFDEKFNSLYIAS